MMLLGEHMIIDLPVCTEDLSLDQVYEMLCLSDERMVIVVDSNAHRVPIGIITERSICAQVVGRRRDPRSLTAANVLDTNIKKLRRATVIESSPASIAFGQHPVIVVDRDRKLVGLYCGTRDINSHMPQTIGPAADYSALPAVIA